MEKEKLILKWLDNEPLTPAELEVFKNLDTYNAIVDIGNSAKAFKAPYFDQKNNLQQILNTSKVKTKQNRFALHWVLKIAAISVIAFSIYYGLSNTGEKRIRSKVAETKITVLPDQSEVVLNAASSITYDKYKWENERTIRLKGEAFFKVAKGKKFDVKTDIGKVTVLGTQFNIIQRDSYFKVACYEGMVGVSIDNTYHQLSPGQALQLIDNELTNLVVTTDNPDWLNNKSSFRSTPFRFVIEEFERQYDKNIRLKNVDTGILFSGNFVHSDLESALQSITVPMQLTYRIKNNTITFSKE